MPHLYLVPRFFKTNIVSALMYIFCKCVSANRFLDLQLPALVHNIRKQHYIYKTILLTKVYYIESDLLPEILIQTRIP